MTYTNSDDDMGGEYKNIDIDLIAGLPATVEFSMETISKYSKAEIQKSFEKLVEDTDIGPEEIDEYKTAFLDPKWTLDLYRDEKYFLTSIEFDYEDPEIVEYIHSLKI